jgi:hypothetical protein
MLDKDGLEVSLETVKGTHGKKKQLKVHIQPLMLFWERDWWT